MGPVGSQRVKVGEVDGSPRVAHWAPDFRDEAECAAVGVVAEQNTLAATFGCDGEKTQDVVLSSKAAGEGKAVAGLLERCNLCFDGSPCRVA